MFNIKAVVWHPSVVENKSGHNNQGNGWKAMAIYAKEQEGLYVWKEEIKEFAAFEHEK
jgi:hypothetical protein